MKGIDGLTQPLMLGDDGGPIVIGQGIVAQLENDARIKGRDVSGFMRSLGYNPATVRWGNGTGEVVKGFKVSDLLMAKKRNAPSPDDDYVPGSNWIEESCNHVTGYIEEVPPF